MTMTERDRAGRTRLHYAVTNGPRDMAFFELKDPAQKAQRLREHLVANTAARLSEPGVDVNACDDEGMTPLHFATQNEIAEPARMLISAGADVAAASVNRTTPLYIAIRNTTPAGLEILTLLLAHGADPTVEIRNGSSALKLAKRAGSAAVLRAFAEHGYQ
jgi:ankyrin repeat protein